MALKRFPIGIQDFERLRNEGKHYVDKTDMIYRLVTTDSYYFLSRPRRFGKSLLLSTLQCYFEGRKELFEGLAIHDLEKEWKRYPVIKISFARNRYDSVEALQTTLNSILEPYETLYCTANRRGNEWGPRLSDLIVAAHDKTGMQPVVLVDEYDAPMLDAMNNPTLLHALRNEMRKLFSPLKDLSGMLRFVFMTGISKFSQLSIFSEVNNLKVITMLKEYSGLCGVTEDELRDTMRPEVQALADANGMTFDEARDALRRMYDGYHFCPNSVGIYNPFSLMNALNDRCLSNYWYGTGTPTFLTHMVRDNGMDPETLDKGFTATLDMFDTPAETASSPIPILYQAGYLTILGTRTGNRYILGFPNDEVRMGFLKNLMPNYAKPTEAENDTWLMQFTDAMDEGNIDKALSLMRSFLSSVPYNADRQGENHYRTLLFFIFKLCTPYFTRVEEASAAGRSDAVVETPKAVYLFEFKLDGNGTVDDALRQIDEKGYLIPYSTALDADGNPKRLYKIGVTFDAERRTVGEWKIVEATEA